MNTPMTQDELVKYLSSGPQRHDLESQRLYTEVAGQAFLDNWNFFARLGYYAFLKMGRGAFCLDFKAQNPGDLALKCDFLPVDKLTRNFKGIPQDHAIYTYNPEAEIVFLVRTLNDYNLSFNLPTKRPNATPKELYEANPEPDGEEGK